ncbi:Mgm101p-domain-containing protein [Nadsonia fulvescens var. elongata DSM 6958]|uniref:Mitochondrial genome maintenance protein MGM101 n=1 Tax=Nadsonia fulvescens var. elongata DSM 6958 TaxID=857566 RepID=A0A1E3PS29_9ASCO|nr:Mgm101p-domain-containing protein [Nadsonia fulvescens var. elongata DSM 6958]
MSSNILPIAFKRAVKPTSLLLNHRMITTTHRKFSADKPSKSRTSNSSTDFKKPEVGNSDSSNRKFEADAILVNKDPWATSLLASEFRDQNEVLSSSSGEIVNEKKNNGDPLVPSSVILSDVDWSTSYSGMGSQPFSREIADILSSSIDSNDIEITPDGLLFLPEIKYRRVLNKAFGPGGWALAPRDRMAINVRTVTREFGLICHGRLVSVARGEQDFFDESNIPTAAEGCKSNAMMRCCKDLGIASELWDPRFIRTFKKKYCIQEWGEHVVNKKKKQLWRRKDDELSYPYKATR